MSPPPARPSPAPAVTLTQEELVRLREIRPAFARHRDTGELFYAALFARDPALRVMFPADIFDQARKLAATLAIVIDAAGDWEALAPILDELALRHLAYGVTPEQYATVGEALFETLRRVGTSEAQLAAWARLYELISARMIDRAYPGRHPGGGHVSNA